MTHHKNLLLGFGNEYCGNDAIGIIVANMLQKLLSDWNIKTGSFSGLDFLEVVEGYETVVIIDSYFEANLKVGEVYELPINRFAGIYSFSYLHSLDLVSALQLGSQLQLSLPKALKIFCIGVDKNGTYGEPINPILKEKIPEIVEKLATIIQISMFN